MLIAHELAHTLQQSDGTAAVIRREKRRAKGRVESPPLAELLNTQATLATSLGNAQLAGGDTSVISDKLSIVNEKIATELKTIGTRQIGEPAAPIDERGDRGSSANDDLHELSGISSASGYDPSSRTVKRTLHVKSPDAENPKRTLGELSFEDRDRYLGLRPGSSRESYMFERQLIIGLNRQHEERVEELRREAEQLRAADIAARREQEYEEGAPEWGALSGRTRSRIAGVTKAAGGVGAVLGSEFTLGTSAVVGADWVQAGLRQIWTGEESTTVMRSGAELISEASGSSVREARVHGDIAETLIDAAAAGRELGASALGKVPTGKFAQPDAAPPAPVKPATAGAELPESTYVGKGSKIQSAAKSADLDDVTNETKTLFEGKPQIKKALAQAPRAARAEEVRFTLLPREHDADADRSSRAHVGNGRKIRHRLQREKAHRLPAKQGQLERL
jgi:hypothetical protein